MITRGELTTRLEAAAGKDPQPEIHVRGDRKVLYEEVVQVMAAVQRAGIKKMGFITDPGA